MWGILAAWEAILDAIIPPRARSARTKSRRIDEIPLAPTDHALLGGHITTLMDYRNPAVQDLVRALKYDASRTAATMAAQLLAEYLREEIAEHALYSSKVVLLVPLPLHKARARERGFNQVEIVFAQLPHEFRNGAIATLAPHALARTRATPPQTRLSRAERLKNVEGAFAVPNPALVANMRVFLIDDVATTGATLINAGKPLEAAGAEVSLIALARA